VFDAGGQEILAANLVGVMNVDIPNTYAEVGSPLYVPINVSTNGLKNGGLQFEMVYDPSKVKFEEIVSNIQEPWLQYVTHDAQKGIIKFGGINNQGKGYLTGDVVPFKLKFAPIGNNPITSNIYIRKLMDASDDNGDRFDMVLRSDVVSLSSRSIPGYYNGSGEDVTASIVPNPNNGMFELVVTFPRNNMQLDARVYDAQGRLIKNLGKISNSEYFLTASNKVDLAGIRQGNYFLTLSDQKSLKVTSKQFLIL
jgi:hypothetical protein